MVKRMIFIGMVSVLICYFNIEIKINKNRFEQKICVKCLVISLTNEICTIKMVWCKGFIMFTALENFQQFCKICYVDWIQLVRYVCVAFCVAISIMLRFSEFIWSYIHCCVFFFISSVYFEWERRVFRFATPTLVSYIQLKQYWLMCRVGGVRSSWWKCYYLIKITFEYSLNSYW